MNKVEDTKQALLLAAGELFAQNGFEGTSTRSIAIKAKANIAAINYHFGGKENLYAEVIHHAVITSRGTSFDDFLPETDLEEDRELVEETVYKIVEALFKVRFSRNRPTWFDKLIMRSLIERPPNFEEVVRKSLKPDHDALKRLALRTKPLLTDRQAHHWVLSVFGQVMIYTFAKDTILTILETRDYAPEYINDAISTVTRVSVAGLYSLVSERN